MSGGDATVAIEARALTKRFGMLTVVDAVDFRLSPGSKTALLGANGAGKTTLLGLLATLVTPSAGAAWIGGESLARPSAALRRRIGVLAHLPMLYEELSALENLTFFARLYGVREAPARIEELLRAVGLWRRRDEPTHVFSRGQHQRLALARALLHTPDVLLLDEPETGLDVAGVALLDELVLTAPGLTVLAATHRVDHVDSWAEGALRLDRGRLVEDTTDRGQSPAGATAAAAVPEGPR
ncbi:MAG: ABC transporter ATP-binding protein [Chloroflexi bacterium]|nr:ABC transporter ATP-binding protein [Chloroflexota bacterium]MQC27839.1 ABC transporter ATP-binding protein [Chloroflexota bacterium]